MAVVRPAYINSGNVQSMDDTMFNSLKNKFRYEFQQASPITLAVVSSGGTLSGLPLTDTRMISGPQSNNGSRFPTEAETGEPTSISVTYSRINQAVSSAPSITSDNGKRYFCYIDSNNDIRAMNYGDMLDTFVRPVIDELVSGSNTSNQAGTYFIDTTATLSANQSLVSSTPIFLDTRANLSSFVAGNIPAATNATLDYPQTINSYYLKKNTMSSPTLGAFPIKIRSDNDLQEFNNTDITSIANELMRNETIASTGGYKIRYNIGGSGTNKGSGIADTRLTGGDGNFQTRQLHADDYRAQEFPNGTPTTINTYFLKIQKTS
tara:strand:+ start:2536 stop:3498 length:963 start_codon:yes stop_codon:yes gene_type:complete